MQNIPSYLQPGFIFPDISLLEVDRISEVNVKGLASLVLRLNREMNMVMGITGDIPVNVGFFRQADDHPVLYSIRRCSSND